MTPFQSSVNGRVSPSSANEKWLFALEFYGVSAVLSVTPAMRGMTPLSMSIAWQLAGTARIWEYGESDPAQATEFASPA